MNFPINPIVTISITLLSVLIVVIFLYILRALFNLRKRKAAAQEKDATEVGFVVDTFHDLVTKLKEKERELELLKRNAEERANSIGLYNENILQSVPSGVVSFDRELKITKMNAAAEKILELKGAGLQGRRYTEAFSDPIADILEKKATVERAEVGYVTRSGKRIWLGLNISPLRDSSSGIIGKILVFTDLTELKAFQSQNELRDRLSTLGEMSAGIAHELRNPMAVISGYAKILLKKVEDASIPAVDAIIKEVAVMDRIITDFLSFAKPAEPALSEVALGELINSCLRAVEGCAADIRIECNTDPLPVIRADEVLLRQALSNLFQNAVEAMPEGGTLKISASVDDRLKIAVSDTGHGIPESIRDRIFLPFYTTKERGTGLGLSIVHKIVVSHGGTVQLDTGEWGTTFTIKFPGEMIVSR